MKRQALFSPGGRHRFTLTRLWDELRPLVVFIGLNPSKADGESDDPTARKYEGFARRWGHGGYITLNLFSLVSTDPEGLAGLYPMTGPDEALDREAKFHLVAQTNHRRIVAAWGSHPIIKETGRADYVLALLAGKRIECLGLTSVDKQPRHALYAPYAKPLEVYREGAVPPLPPPAAEQMTLDAFFGF